MTLIRSVEFRDAGGSSYASPPYVTPPRAAALLLRGPGRALVAEVAIGHEDTHDPVRFLKVRGVKVWSAETDKGSGEATRLDELRAGLREFNESVTSADPELRAIEQCLVELEALEPAERSRALEYLAARLDGLDLAETR